MELEFTRDAQRGMDVEWFAVDRRGALAILTTGYGVIPKAVFENEERHRRLTDFFGALPETSQPEVPERLAVQGSCDLSLQEARRGLYSYFHASYGVFDSYELTAYPVVPTTLDTLPADIVLLLRPFRFERLEFATAKHIFVQEHFDCDE